VASNRRQQNQVERSTQNVTNVRVAQNFTNNSIDPSQPGPSHLLNSTQALQNSKNTMEGNLQNNMQFTSAAQVSSPQNSQQAPRLHLGTKTHSKHHQNINLPQLQSNLVDQSHQQFRLNSPSNNPAAINIRYHVQNGLNQQPQSTKNSTVDTSTAGVLEKQRMSKNKQKIVQKLNSYADVHDENVSLQPQAVAEDVFRS